MATRTISTIKQPYYTSKGEKLYLGTSTEVEVDSNGKYIPGSARISLRLYTGTGFLGTAYKTVAIREPGKAWIPTQDANQNYVAGIDLRETLANKNSMMNINLNNHVSNALQAPLQGVPAGQVNTNTKKNTNAALGLPQAAGPNPDPSPGADPPEVAAAAAEAESSIGFQNAPPILKYPFNHDNDQYDFLQIQPAKYVPGVSIGAGPSGTENAAKAVIGLESVKTRITNTEGFPKIFLPMTPGITESNQVGWGEDRLNPVQAAYGQAAAQIIDNPTNVFANLDTLNETTQKLLNNSGLGNFVTAYFAGKAVSANILGRSGIVLNPNLELLFQGPKLRSFKYSFRFTPRDDPEAKEIRKIIRTFKKTMAPTRTNLFLGVPCVYLLKYVFKGENGGQDHPYMNKIKPCALVAFDVNYGPDGSYMTYQTGSMTSYTVNMQFDELEPIYNDDIDGNTDSPTMGY